MRHLKRKGKLNRTSAHRNAMLSNMSVSLFCHEQIVTTIEKARALRPVAEKMITMARDHSLHVRRLLLAKIGDRGAVCKLLSVLGPRYRERNGGYVRIIKYKTRPGDSADLAVVEFVERNIEVKGKTFAMQGFIG